MSNEDLYQELAEIVNLTIANVFLPFQSMREALMEREELKFNESDFSERFFTFSDVFAEDTCKKIAYLVRTKSASNEIRSTPTDVLSKQIRRDVFDKHDQILFQYAAIMKQIGVELKSTNVVTSAVDGAIVGRVLSGFGQESNKWAVAGAVLSVVAEAQRQANLRIQARTASYIMMLKYFETLKHLPEKLLDYSCSKIIGASIDFPAMESAIAGLNSKMETNLEMTVDTIQRMLQKPIKDNSLVGSVHAVAWYNNNIYVHIAVLFCFPIGLYGIWKNTKLPKWWKIIVTAFYVIVMLSGIIQQKQ